MSVKRPLTNDEVRQILREQIANSCQTAFAERHNISRVVLNGVLRGRRRTIPESILRALGLRRVQYYEPHH